MIACQCMMVFLGPRAVWICREGDGTAHTELISANCCDSGSSLSPIIAPGLCAAGDCLDEPIDHAPAVRPARPISVASPRHALPYNRLLWASAEPPSTVTSMPARQVTLTAHGPPVPSRLALRATILQL